MASVTTLVTSLLFSVFFCVFTHLNMSIKYILMFPQSSQARKGVNKTNNIIFQCTVGSMMRLHMCSHQRKRSLATATVASVELFLRPSSCYVRLLSTFDKERKKMVEKNYISSCAKFTLRQLYNMPLGMFYPNGGILRDDKLADAVYVENIFIVDITPSNNTALQWVYEYRHWWTLLRL